MIFLAPIARVIALALRTASGTAAQKRDAVLAAVRTAFGVRLSAAARDSIVEWTSRIASVQHYRAELREPTVSWRDQVRAASTKSGRRVLFSGSAENGRTLRDWAVRPYTPRQMGCGVCGATSRATKATACGMLSAGGAS